MEAPSEKNVFENDVEPALPQANCQNRQCRCNKISIYDVLEMVLLTPVILATIAFFSIPTILYALPDSSFEMGIMNRNGFNETGMNGSFMDGMMMVEVMDGRIESMMMDGNMGSFNFEDMAPVCSAGFYLDDGVNGTNTCRPLCGEFLKKNFAAIFCENFLIVVSIIVCIAMFLLAGTVQREKLLVFPSITLIYVCISIIVLSASFFIGFLDNKGLYCGDQRDYLTLLGGSETPYTTISGITFAYFVIQLNYWFTMHSIILFWSVRFPLSHRRFRISGRLRYAHINVIIFGIVLPFAAPLVLLLKGGYLIPENPTLYVVGRNGDIYFFLFTLHASVMVCIMSIMLILIFWTILKEFVLKKLLAKRKVVQVHQAELKIMFLLACSAILSVLGLGSQTYIINNANYQNSVFAYVGCEMNGLPFVNCFELLEGRMTVEVVATMGNCTLFLIPLMIMIFTINVKVYKGAMKTISNSSIFQRRPSISVASTFTASTFTASTFTASTSETI